MKAVQDMTRDEIIAIGAHYQVRAEQASHYKAEKEELERTVQELTHQLKVARSQVAKTRRLNLMEPELAGEQRSAA